MGSVEKKKLKAEAKAHKKKLKAEFKNPTNFAKEAEPSPIIKFAEAVRGILYLILAVSMVIAIAFSDKGSIVTLNKLFDSLILAWAGKILLLLIAAAFFILGLKHLRAVK